MLCMLTAGLSVGFGTTGSSFAFAYQDDAAKADADAPAEPEAAPDDEADKPAAKDSPDVTPGEKENFLIVLAKANGWFFGPVLLLLSFVMVALIMMNAMQVRRDVLLPQSFVEAFEQHLTNKDYQGAYETAKSDDSFVARVLEAGLRKLNRGYSEAIEGMQEVGEDENMALEHRISYLALIGSIAPMIGLMGTVWGMIGAFEEIATSVSQPKPKDLAANIQTALITTLEGLMIAIPAIVAYSILRNRVSRYVLEVGMISESFMSRFAVPGKTQQKPPSGGAASATAGATPQA
ncbi:MAG: MotA/TolQ/ExbB proton channel family protein [Planctomycetes bacterium]|nr:MotA/TolQ/ExbB proton channel family protein [Planctomycetota bacterium]